MKINVGKWLRRQVFAGKPVTAENTFLLMAGKLGYKTDDISEAVLSIAWDLYVGDLTAKELRETLDYEAQRILLAEAQKWRERIEALLSAIPTGAGHVG